MCVIQHKMVTKYRIPNDLNETISAIEKGGLDRPCECLTVLIRTAPVRLL